jgi:aminomethyltransferase
VNASNRTKILDWIDQHRGGFNADLTDLTFDQPMVAIQGPAAVAIAEEVTSTPLAAMKYYTAAEIEFDGRPAIVSRTGYTGEDGVELIVPTASALRLWEALAGNESVTPCGLGCRDTLRLEAAMPLYGHELDESQSIR